MPQEQGNPELITAESMPGHEEFQAEQRRRAAANGTQTPQSPAYHGGYNGQRLTQPHGPVVNDPRNLAMMRAAAASYGGHGEAHRDDQ